jgi:hypothetical protein
MFPLVGNSDGSSELYGRNHDDGSLWRYRCSLVVGSGDGSSERSTLWPKSMVLTVGVVGGDLRVAFGGQRHRILSCVCG